MLRQSPLWEPAQIMGAARRGRILCQPGELTAARETQTLSTSEQRVSHQTDPMQSPEAETLQNNPTWADVENVQPLEIDDPPPGLLYDRVEKPNITYQEHIQQQLPPAPPQQTRRTSRDRKPLVIVYTGW